MNNVPHIVSPTYVSFAPTPNVTDLRFIICYTYGHWYFTEHQLSCIEIDAFDILNPPYYLYMYATYKYNVINNVLLSPSHVKA